MAFNHLLRRCCMLELGLFQHARVASVKTCNVVSLPRRVLHAGLFCNNDGRVGGGTLHRENINLVRLHQRTVTKKAKAKKKAASVGGKVDLSIGSDIVDLNRISDEMGKITERLVEEFRKMYSNTMNAATLDNIKVTVGGRRTQLSQVAAVRSVDKDFVVTPMIEDKEGAKEIFDSIVKSGLSLNPSFDGSVIRIQISMTSSEYKDDTLKLCKVSAENSKNAIRKIRQKYLTKAKNHPESKEIMKHIEIQIQMLTDTHCKEVESMLSKKTLELKT